MTCAKQRDTPNEVGAWASVLLNCNLHAFTQDKMTKKSLARRHIVHHSWIIFSNEKITNACQNPLYRFDAKSLSGTNN